MSNAGSLGASAQELNSVAASGFSFRNRIINGDMRIDQRNAGASVNIPLGFANYTLDRWLVQSAVANKVSVQKNAGSVTPPEGFTDYLGVTSLSAYTAGASEYFALMQSIEGLNVADLDWGKSTAKAATFSFWVRSSITGTHSGAALNYNGTRGYPFTFQIAAANTWEYKTVTIPGDTTGTWKTDTNTGVTLRFDLGSGSTFRFTAGSWGANNPNGATGAVSVIGTNGATFYVTGVQFERGSVATPFERRPFSDELARCQRYYTKSYNLSEPPGTARTIGTASVGAGSGNAFSSGYVSVFFPVRMRAAPTVTTYDCAGTAGKFSFYNAGWYNGGVSTTIPFEAGATIAVNGSIYYASLEYTASAEL